MEIQLGMIQTVAVALAILFLGYFLNDKIALLKSNNIPEPVVGGITFAVLSAVLYSQFHTAFVFDTTLKNPLMLVFFTTVGLGASLKLLARGGPKVLLFLGISSGALSGLTALEPYRPLLLVVGGAALAFGLWRIVRRRSAGEPASA